MPAEPDSAINDIQSCIVAAALVDHHPVGVQWLANPDALKNKPRDLVTVVRPTLITLGNDIILKIKEHLQQQGPFTASERSDFMSQMTVHNLSKEDKAALYNALMQIRLK